MTTRVVLLHAYLPSMAPMDDAFKSAWPEAEILNLLDEALYADVGSDGSMPATMADRLARLFRHCEVSGAAGVVFTGSTFGPLVERARASVSIPVLKSDEAVAEIAVRSADRILVAGTASRSLPIVRGNIEAAAAAAGVERSIDTLLVPGAKQAISDGDRREHDRLIADHVARVGASYDAIVFGQVSMVPARAGLPVAIARRVLTSPDAAVIKLRSLLETERVRLDASTRPPP